MIGHEGNSMEENNGYVVYEWNIHESAGNKVFVTPHAFISF